MELIKEIIRADSIQGVRVNATVNQCTRRRFRNGNYVKDDMFAVREDTAVDATLKLVPWETDIFLRKESSVTNSCLDYGHILVLDMSGHRHATLAELLAYSEKIQGDWPEGWPLKDSASIHVFGCEEEQWVPNKLARGFSDTYHCLRCGIFSDCRGHRYLRHPEVSKACGRLCLGMDWSGAYYTGRTYLLIAETSQG